MEKLLKDNFNVHVDCHPKNKHNIVIQNHPQYKHFQIYDDKNLITHARLKQSHIVESLHDLDLLLHDNIHENKYIVIYKNFFSWAYSMKNATWDLKAPGILSMANEYIAYLKKWSAIKNERVLLINYNQIIKELYNKNYSIINIIGSFIELKKQKTILL